MPSLYIKDFIQEKVKNDPTTYIIYFFVLLSIVMSGLILSDIKKSGSSINFLNGLIVIVPFILIFLSIFLLRRNNNAIFYVSFIALFLLFLFAAFYVYINSLSNAYKNIINGSFVLLFAVSLLIALAMFYNVFSDRIRRIDDKNGWFINFIFFVPCLLSDFIEYIRKELKLTSSTVYILLFLEAAILAVYYYLPPLFQWHLKSHGKTLLHDSLFFKDPKIVAHYSELPKIHKSLNPTMMQNYAISMWIYVNPNSTSSENKQIFSYGSEDFKPKITYATSDDSINDDSYKRSKKEKLKIILYGNDSNIDNNNIIYVHVDGQKWNNIVFNYYKHNVDVYINGKMEYSIYYPTNSVRFNNQDKIELGVEVDEFGNNKYYLNGAICNVVYFTKALTRSQIATQYNLLFMQNPPVNNIL